MRCIQFYNLKEFCSATSPLALKVSVSPPQFLTWADQKCTQDSRHQNIIDSYNSIIIFFIFFSMPFPKDLTILLVFDHSWAVSWHFQRTICNNSSISSLNANWLFRALVYIPILIFFFPFFFFLPKRKVPYTLTVYSASLLYKNNYQ